MHIFKKRLTALFISILSISTTILPVYAATQVSEAVTSSVLDSNWPTGPDISSETAILIEAETGTILYQKDMHKQMYPASITKVLTTLIATERCELDETVVFTEETLQTIPADSSRIWVDSNEYMSMEDCLAAILIVSANDVAAGVAEHIGGTLEAFADIMNERAKELGCLNSHFVNAHGYHDPEHYTTAYDMAQIGRAFFENDLLCTFALKRDFHVYPSEGQPDEIWEFNKNKLLETRSYEYEYLIGSKTGYTSQAGQTLISCARKDGMKLICVVMNAVSPEQYKDTVTLFDFGFSNFTAANIYDNDKTYVTADSSYGMEVKDVLGNSSPLLSMDKNSIVVLPNSADFSDLTSYITLATEEENCIATAHYQYGTYPVGSAQIYVSSASSTTADNPGELEYTEETVPVEEPEEAPVYVNIKKIALIAIPSICAITALFLGYRKFRAYRFSKNPALTKRKLTHRLSFFKKFFIGLAQLLQAIGYLFAGMLRSTATKNRYKSRYSSQKKHSSKKESDTRSGRTASREYYQKSADLKRKNVTFHDPEK